MDAHKFKIADNYILIVREATPEDATALIAYIETVSDQSDFLSFGRGDFGLTELQEQAFLRQCRTTDNQIYLVGLINNRLVSTLHFAGGSRPRVRHAGEFGMSVDREFWGLGIGSLMIETLLIWARETHIVKKINLRVRTDNQRAIHLYERKGFIKEGTIHKEIFLQEDYFDHDWMGLEL